MFIKKIHVPVVIGKTEGGGGGGGGGGDKKCGVARKGSDNQVASPNMGRSYG